VRFITRFVFFFVFRVFLRYFYAGLSSTNIFARAELLPRFFCFGKPSRRQRDVSFLFVLASSLAREREKMVDDIVDAAFSLFPQFFGKLGVDLFLVSEGRDAFRKEKNLGGD